jgi:CCR4-NOT transcriptional complex subunit CAF120
MVSKFQNQGPWSVLIASIGCLVRDVSRDVPTTLVRGRREGWVLIRIAGQTDWKRVWMIVTAGSESGVQGDRLLSSGRPGGALSPNTLVKKKRMSHLFSWDSTASQHPTASSKPSISVYTSNKPKDKRKPILTVNNVTQVFAVYPERPELISRSTLIKMEGLFGDEEMAAAMKSREGWLLMMPEPEGMSQSGEMLKWIIGEFSAITTLYCSDPLTIALHDAFELYGRPESWTWDPRESISLMFGYPVGPNKDVRSTICLMLLFRPYYGSSFCFSIGSVRKLLTSGMTVPLLSGLL